MVDRDLKDASIEEVSLDARFGFAYHAVLVLAKIAVACRGYRVKGLGAHHTTIAALPLALGSEVRERAAYFDLCRRKRNLLSYTTAGETTEAEVAELIKQARGLREKISRWVEANYPELVDLPES